MKKLFLLLLFIPLMSFGQRDIIVVCASGARSGKANSILKKNGIKSANGGSWSSLK